MGEGTVPRYRVGMAIVGGGGRGSDGVRVFVLRRDGEVAMWSRGRREMPRAAAIALDAWRSRGPFACTDGVDSFVVAGEAGDVVVDIHRLISMRYDCVIVVRARHPVTDL